MKKNRLEAFSDGVLAIIITIMVLEMKVPHGSDLEALRPLLPVFLSYILSFVYIAIYWNNHHHLLHAAEHVTASILWTNMHLLFWLSLLPFVTSWMGENNFAQLPIVLYGIVLLMAGVAYFLLQKAIISSQGNKSILGKAIGRDFKGKASIALYLVALIVSFYVPWVAGALYVFVAMLWLVPDRRIEKALS